MPASKKPRKRHTMTKRHDRVASAILTNVLAAWVPGNEHVNAFRRDGTPGTLGDASKRSLMYCALPWSSLCCVLCRDQAGQEYIQSKLIKSGARYRYETLADRLNTEHQQLIREANSLHLVSVAWVASPVGAEISDEIADKILTQLGAWNALADWEQGRAA